MDYPEADKRVKFEYNVVKIFANNEISWADHELLTA